MTEVERQQHPQNRLSSSKVEGRAPPGRGDESDTSAKWSRARQKEPQTANVPVRETPLKPRLSEQPREVSPHPLQSCRIFSSTRLSVEVPQDQYRRLLVQWLVVVAALGGLDAGGTPVLAGTLLYQAEGGLPQLLHQLIALLGDADAAGVAVVDEDLGPAGIGVLGGGDPANIIPVT